MGPLCAPAVTIQSALRDFLEDRRGRLGAVDYRLYQHVVFFLELCINNYGHRNLAEADRARFERLFFAPAGGADFFEIFGPELLLPELDFFTRSYLHEDVHVSDRVTEKSATVVSDLRDWLVRSGRIEAAVVEEQERLGLERARLSHRLKRLARLLSRQLVSVDLGSLEDRDYVGCDDHLILRVEPGRVWLRVYRCGEPDEVGPVVLPVGVTSYLREGWNLCGALGRLRGRWHLVEVAYIHPRVEGM
jgi:hypothetical protein